MPSTNSGQALRLVYALYGLTEEEIKIEEGSGFADRLIGDVKNNPRRHPSENGVKVSTHKEGCKYAILITN